MPFTGPRRYRLLIFAITAFVWLTFVWFLLPDETISREIKSALGEPPVSLRAGDRTSPLTIGLKSLHIPPRVADAGLLTLRVGDTESPGQVAVGQQVAIDGIDFEVTAIRPWAGLIHRPPGMPMLNVAVRPHGAEWIENVFVERGGARIVTPEVAVLVLSGDAPSTARPARWGVVEGERTHWFSSFVPGTGLDLDGGDGVTLLVRKPSGRILVEITEDGGRTELWVDANRYQPGGQIRYEDPGVVAYHIEIGSDERSGLTVSLVEGDLVRWTRHAEIGSILADAGSGLSMRIDQDEQEALALFAEESPWLEVVLATPSSIVRIREGEAVRVGEITASFEAFEEPRPTIALIKIGDREVSFDEDTVYVLEDRWFDGMRALSPAEVALVVHSSDGYGLLRVCLTGLFFVIAMAISNGMRRRA